MREYTPEQLETMQDITTQLIRLGRDLKDVNEALEDCTIYRASVYVRNADSGKTQCDIRLEPHILEMVLEWERGRINNDIAKLQDELVEITKEE